MAHLRKPIWILWIFLLLTLGKSAPFSMAYSDLMASAHCECCLIKNPNCRHCAAAKPKLINKVVQDSGLYAVDCQGKKVFPDFYQMLVSDVFVTEQAVRIVRSDLVMGLVISPHQGRSLFYSILSPPPKTV